MKFISLLNQAKRGGESERSYVCLRFSSASQKQCPIPTYFCARLRMNSRLNRCKVDTQFRSQMGVNCKLDELYYILLNTSMSLAILLRTISSSSSLCGIDGLPALFRRKCTRKYCREFLPRDKPKFDSAYSILRTRVLPNKRIHDALH